MHNPFNQTADLLNELWQDLRQSWPMLVTFEMLFQLFKTWLALPLISLLLVRILAYSGRVAVSNHDLLNFLLTPLGLLYGTLFICCAVALLLVEQAGIMILTCLEVGRKQWSFESTLPQLMESCWRIARLGVLKVFLLTLTLLPIVLLGSLAYLLLLTQYDIYYYLKSRPPEYWQAISIGGGLLTIATIIGFRLYLLWAFALPVLLYESQPPREALQISRTRMQSAGWRVRVGLLVWMLFMLLLAIVLTLIMRTAIGMFMQWNGEIPADTVLIIALMLHGLGMAVISFLTNVGQVLMVRRLYLRHHPASQQLEMEAATPSDLEKRTRYRGIYYFTGIAVVVSLVAPILVWSQVAKQLAELPVIGVTAHRGHARRAPENTLAAIQKAIESGADYVEIDVHQTSDGVVVLLHDRDLRRVAGVSSRLDELKFNEIRQLDVGSWFAPQFADQRIPTLEEAIELCRGKIQMNIELKMFESHQDLPGAVGQLLIDNQFTSQAIVTSLDHRSVLTMKERFPHVRTGLIVAHAIGPINRLNFDVLSVRQEFLSDALFNEARRNGREVHAWTVNQKEQMIRLIQRGVDNLITSDPDLAIEIRKQWADLSHTEQLLISTRLLLGLPPS